MQSERKSERSRSKIYWPGAESERLERWSGSEVRSGRSRSGNGAESRDYRIMPEP